MVCVIKFFHSKVAWLFWFHAFPFSRCIFIAKGQSYLRPMSLSTSLIPNKCGFAFDLFFFSSSSVSLYSPVYVALSNWFLSVFSEIWRLSTLSLCYPGVLCGGITVWNITYLIERWILRIVLIRAGDGWWYRRVDPIVHAPRPISCAGVINRNIYSNARYLGRFWRPHNREEYINVIQMVVPHQWQILFASFLFIAKPRVANLTASLYAAGNRIRHWHRTVSTPSKDEPLLRPTI